MSGRSVRQLHVVRKHHLSPNMIRIVLGGQSLSDFPTDMAGGYVKLRFPVEGRNKPIMRSYTIRTFDPQLLELTLDFVSHGDNGPASAWAINAQIEDQIEVDGPGGVKLLDSSADWFFIAGDMTALPAIAVNLEALPEDAKGYAVIEVLSEADKQTLHAPKGVELHWVINSKPDQPNSCLINAVKALPWLDGVASVWCASEFESMRSLRRYFKTERLVERGRAYASSYWKMGETDEGNKAAKRADTEAD